ncbi:MAG TPA: superoxide dismutase family protein [Polyangiaceae bacterium]|nr:superoxide dismutase family protein [Polyangiaceae bacterium]
MLRQPSFQGAMGVLAIAGLASACTSRASIEEIESESQEPLVGVANAVMLDAAGNQVALVRFGQHSVGSRVQITATGLSTGIHAFHVHANNDPTNGDGCIGPTFVSADGHYNPAAVTHPNHAGDMPVVFFSAGSPNFGFANFITSNFTPDEVKGRVVILHALADNCANIPERYTAAGVPGPDATSLATGDAGGRVACGVITD